MFPAPMSPKFHAHVSIFALTFVEVSVNKTGKGISPVVFEAAKFAVIEVVAAPCPISHTFASILGSSDALSALPLLLML